MLLPKLSPGGLITPSSVICQSRIFLTILTLSMWAKLFHQV
jgi:hypothetical protein